MIKPDRPPVEFEHVFALGPKVALQARLKFEQRPVPKQVELHIPRFPNVQSDPQVVHVVWHDVGHDVPQTPAPVHEKLQ